VEEIQYLYTKNNKIFGELKYIEHISSDYSKHFHTHFGLGLIEEGELEIVYDRANNQILDNQSIAVFNPSQVHCSKSLKAAKYYVLFLNEQWCKNIQENYSFKTNIVKNVDMNKALLNLFHRLICNKNLYIEEELKAIVEKMFRMHGGTNNSKESFLVSKTKSYINKCSTRSISVDEVAKHVGYNKSYLIRLFHKEVGLTPQQYILSVKVNHAKDLLTSSKNDSLSTISANAGFFDQSHFNRNFKSHFGETAKRYKKVNIVQDTKKYI